MNKYNTIMLHPSMIEVQDVTKELSRKLGLPTEIEYGSKSSTTGTTTSYLNFSGMDMRVVTRNGTPVYVPAINMAPGSDDVRRYDLEAYKKYEGTFIVIDTTYVGTDEIKYTINHTKSLLSAIEAIDVPAGTVAHYTRMEQLINEFSNLNSAGTVPVNRVSVIKIRDVLGTDNDIIVASNNIYVSKNDLLISPVNQTCYAEHPFARMSTTAVSSKVLMSLRDTSMIHGIEIVNNTDPGALWYTYMLGEVISIPSIVRSDRSDGIYVSKPVLNRKRSVAYVGQGHKTELKALNSADTQYINFDEATTYGFYKTKDLALSAGACSTDYKKALKKKLSKAYKEEVNKQEKAVKTLTLKLHKEEQRYSESNNKLILLQAKYDKDTDKVSLEERALKQQHEGEMRVLDMEMRRDNHKANVWKSIAGIVTGTIGAIMLIFKLVT